MIYYILTEDGKIVNYDKGNYYTNPPVATCSRRQAVCLVLLILSVLLACALIVAFVRPGQCLSADQDDLDAYFFNPAYLTGDTNGTTAVTNENGELIASNGDPFPWNNIRLPDSLIPLRYSVVLHPNLTTLFLRGQMEVIFAVQKETNFIVFHGKNVTLTVVMVKDLNQREILNTRILYYPPHQQIYIELKNYLQVGSNYSLALRYEGKVRTDLEGLYLSSYKAPNGMKR